MSTLLTINRTPVKAIVNTFVVSIDVFGINLQLNINSNATVEMYKNIRHFL